jgi:ABC-type phosphate transport system permease subunit
MALKICIFFVAFALTTRIIADSIFSTRWQEHATFGLICGIVGTLIMSQIVSEYKYHD